jgi:3-oxoacyl-[acyl-carrier-protein] synthase II
MNVRRRVVITGIGGVTPLGTSMKESWENVIAGKSGIRPITRFDVSAYATRIAGEVINFEPTKYFEAKDIKKVDYFTQFAVAAAQEAYDDALFRSASYDMRRVGSILGVGIGGLTILEKYHEALLSGGPRKVSPFLIPGMITNLAPGHVAIRFGLRGANYAIQSACTSANHALGESYRMIRDGLQDAVFSGGAEGAITPTGIGGFCAMKAMSTRNDEPTKASRPFDKERDGFVMGEGSVVLLLEALDKALERNAKIYGEIVGYGFSCDAYHITSPTPDGDGAVACMEMALQDAGIRPQDVDYINAHGTSTPANDMSETAAIKRLFGDHVHKGLLVSSTKSSTGHLLGAAGAIEAAFSAMALCTGKIPPTLNLDNPDDGADLDFVPHHMREKQITYALSNSYGFGGTNASLLLRRWQ